MEVMIAVQSGTLLHAQTCFGGFIKTQLYATFCCFFIFGEYARILVNLIKSTLIKSRRTTEEEALFI